MATLEISEPMFAETIENNELVLLDFWAEWCGPCKAYGPVYERVSNDFPDVVFGKIDTEEQQALAGMFGIRSIPTTIAFKEGIGVFMQPVLFQKMRFVIWFSNSKGWTWTRSVLKSPPRKAKRARTIERITLPIDSNHSFVPLWPWT